jgi:N-acetylglutamate synthase-like GNAT family acetyltransferase
MNSQRSLSDESLRLITHFEPGDIGEIIALHGKHYYEEFGFGLGFEKYVARTFAEFVCQFQENTDRIWIAKAGNEVKGCIALVHRDAQTAQLRYFITSPDYRGKGLGKRLFLLCMDRIRMGGYSQAYLWTSANLTTAASLYLKAGFRKTEERKSTNFGVPMLEQKYTWQPTGI